MEEKKGIVHLSVFLIKEAFSKRGEVIKEDECSGPLEVPISGAGKGLLYWKPSHPDYPKWTSLFADSIDIKQIGKTANISVVFLLKVDGRYFALTFGQGGRFLLKDEVFEERFGLLVALNSVTENSFRCVDKQSLDTIQSHTRIQSGEETSVNEFGLDVEQDMLKAIVGSPKYSRLGNRMAGSDSLSVFVRMDLSDLPFLLKSYKEKFEQDLNATDYDWVNNIAIVKSSSLTAELENKLLGKFAKHDYSNLWLAIPEIIDWNLVKGFIYTNGKQLMHPDVNLKGFLATVKQGTAISIELLRTRKVHCADADHNSVHKSWSIYRCLYAEIDHDNKKFVLTDGKWFQVSVDFVARTNKDFERIERSSLNLPVYADVGEGAYNKRVCALQPNQFALLDAENKIFHGGGRGQVEVCDLFSMDKQLIHVKVYGKSSVLSHLFSQGFVSGQLIQLDAEFRRKVKGRLKTPFNALITVGNRPADNEFTIIFAVISDTPGMKLHLPFFSRVNLNNTAKVLCGFGYKVELLKIMVDEIYAKTAKAPPAH